MAYAVGVVIMGMRLQDVEEIYTLLVETKNTMELPKK
jgi:hypothetical protein